MIVEDRKYGMFEGGSSLALLEFTSLAEFRHISTGGLKVS